jgi:hypothetical protein
MNILLKFVFRLHIPSNDDELLSIFRVRENSSFYTHTHTHTKHTHTPHTLSLSPVRSFNIFEKKSLTKMEMMLLIFVVCFNIFSL